MYLLLCWSLHPVVHCIWCTVHYGGGGGILFQVELDGMD